ncbi:MULTISPECIES: tetratricopeptide repeat protein [Mesotoga]|jgi:tetratricopeptide (TPR) repeat protein|uniref:tetratricopeptide repeat protein n=1 Tax=Mesotoga TaxID=1184396 RepID=UPI0002CA8B15|nr:MULTISPECIES: tetratricopeptide repeat protein [Mesotoga]MCP5456574.1 tetratricopeptide repeat protein [Thermotogota bacterium]CCU85840.1 Tetratricopeptide TPR_2 repeat protein [Mesotoga infera]MCB1223317.1 tetratricopeptide repeat protein [Mesotoga sp.]MCP5460530.1 tetratricopeptide repeat protein [Thermotogota bacterium]MDK2943303.1 hypothetical protein [Mesotoga sp.]
MEIIRLKKDKKSFDITDTLPFAIAILDEVYDGDINVAIHDLKSTKIGKDLLTIGGLAETFDNVVTPENYAPIEYEEFNDYLKETGLSVASFTRGTFSGFQDKILSIADRGDYESAQKFLDLLMDANVDKATVCELKGSIFLESGDEEEGIKWLQNALKIDSSLVTAYSFLGQTFYNRGDFDSAADCWQREIAASPDHLVTYFMLTDAYINAGRMDEALNVLKDLSKRDPDSILTKVEMAELYEKMGNIEMRRIVEDEVLRTKPVYINDVEPWAKIQFKHSNYDVVEEVATNFLKENPDRPELKMLLVVSHMKKGQCDEAKRLLKEFENEQVWYFYGKKELFDEYLTEEERKQCGIT